MTKTEIEKKYKHYIDGFYPIACKVLKDFPKELEEFNKYWNLREYRRAYMPFMEVFHDREIKLSEEEVEIKKEFYGLFVN